MSKLGFLCQRYHGSMDRILRAGPRALICVETPGLIDQFKPLAPDALYIYRDYTDTQPLDDPARAAADKVEALKPAIFKSGEHYHGFQLYNEIAQYDLKAALAFQRFQLACMDLLEPMGVKVVAADNDSTWHPALPQEYEPLWNIKKAVYQHPACRWRCRHEYERQPHYSGGYDGWTRHKKEIAWLQQQGINLEHIMDEWGWDLGPPVGPWRMGVDTAAWIQGARDYEAMLDPLVVAYGYFGLGLHGWAGYDLLSHEAPDDILPAIEGFMKEVPAIDPSWDRVDADVRRWYPLLKNESFRLWPYKTIPYKGLELHGDRIGAAIILCESGGDPSIRSKYPAVPDYDGKDWYAWGLMQVIAKIPGHPWFASRPTVEQLLDPATNVRWGMAIFHGTLVNTQGANGDVWEALRRYSGYAAPEHSMSEFWEKYGSRFQRAYHDWFGIKIPEPETEEIVWLREERERLRGILTSIRNTANAGLDG